MLSNSINTLQLRLQGGDFMCHFLLLVPQHRRRGLCCSDCSRSCLGLHDGSLQGAAVLPVTHCACLHAVLLAKCGRCAGKGHHPLQQLGGYTVMCLYVCVHRAHSQTHIAWLSGMRVVMMQGICINQLASHVAVLEAQGLQLFTARAHIMFGCVQIAT